MAIESIKSVETIINHEEVNTIAGVGRHDTKARR